MGDKKRTGLKQAKFFKKQTHSRRTHTTPYYYKGGGGVMKTKYLLKSDKRIVTKIANGWLADRDYNVATISKGPQQIKISVACYRRLQLAGLAPI